MHEVSIVEALIEQVGEEVERAGASGRVTRLALSIGQLSGVHSDSIRFAFELLSPGTILEGATKAPRDDIEFEESTTVGRQDTLIGTSTNLAIAILTTTLTITITTISILTTLQRVRGIGLSRCTRNVATAGPWRWSRTDIRGYASDLVSLHG